MSVLEMLRRPARRKLASVRPGRLGPEVEARRGEINLLVGEFLRGSKLPIMRLVGQEVRLGAGGVYLAAPFTVGGHGWVFCQGGDFGFALNTAGHWSYVGRYGVRGQGRTETVALWSVNMGCWPKLDQDGAVCVTNAGWASPAHVVLAAKMAVAVWRP